MTTPTASEGEFPTSYEQYQADRWPYEVVPKDPDQHDDAVTWQGLHEFAFQAENGEVYAGCYPRAMINNAANTDQPLMIGASDRGNQSVGILHDERYRHIFCGGQTGAGKTVAAKNAIQQDALAGHGDCVIDPGGEDILDIVRSLPEYRLDDLIYMEPGNEYRSHSIGLNYLDTLHNPGEPGYKKECESIATNLLPMLNADEFARMKGVASNMLRYLIKADYEDDDYEYTLIDLYYMLASDDARQQYAEKVNESKLDFLKVYANKIAELAGDELEPLLRRLQTWVENDVMRPFIAQRDSDFSIADAVENQRIVLVKANLGKNEREMITAALTTKLWSAITSRPNADERTMMEYEGVDVPELGAEDGGDHKPFFLVADEFHAVASENTDIGEMLAMARKKGLGLYILTQQLGQLSEEQQQQILGNCSTLMAFDPGRHPKERRALASGFDGISEPDLGIGRYKFWTTLTDEEGDESQAFLTHSIPPFPPVRSVKEANEALNRSQKLHGSKRLTDQDIIEQVPDEFSIEAAKESLDDEITTDEITANTSAQALYEAIYTIQLKRNAIGEFVESEAVKDEWRRRAGELGFASEVSNVIEQAPDEYIERDRREGKPVMKVTPEGLEYAGLAQDTGSSASGGSDEHRWVLTEAYRAFTKLGMYVELPTQEGEEAPDGIADLPVDPMEGGNVREIHAREQQLEDEYPYLADLTDGLNISIEAETSTLEKPMQTLTNLRKAIDEHKLCVFACKDGTAKHDRFDYWPRRGEGIIYDTTGRGANRTIHYDRMTFAADVDEGDNRTFYNKVETLAVASDTYALRPRSAANLVWREEGEEVVMSDEDGTEHARFESPETAVDPSKSDVPAYSEYDASEREYTVRTSGEKLVYGSRDELEEDWMVVRAPFIPENEFDRMPTPEDFLFVVFPDDDTEEYTEPMICEQGETRPLLPMDTSWDIKEKADTNGSVDNPTDKGLVEKDTDEQARAPPPQEPSDEEDEDDGVSFARSGR